MRTDFGRVGWPNSSSFRFLPAAEIDGDQCEAFMPSLMIILLNENLRCLRSV
jgi:hypothetical protein